MRRPLPYLLLFALGLLSLNTLADSQSVSVVSPKAFTPYQRISITGTVEATQDAAVASLVSGRVDILYVEAGDRVEQGQPLLKLDTTLAALTYKETKASLEAAKIAVEEATRLYQEVLALSKQKVVAQTVISERRSTLAIAKAALAEQKARYAKEQELIDRHTLYAPFSGVIANRFVDLGEWVSQQSQVFQLVNDELRVRVEVPQEHYSLLQGQDSVPALILPDVTHVEPLKLALSRLVGVVNKQSRTLTAFIDLPKDVHFIAGMSANTEIQVAQQAEPQLWLPASALKHHPDGGKSVFAVIDNIAKRFIVDVTQTKGGEVALSGAPAQHQYIVSGVELMKEGAHVTAVRVKGEAL